jgi:putative SOS response-associated peptidase YedK
MCNIYTWKMAAVQMRVLKLHYQFIGTSWTEWEERQSRGYKPFEEVYPNKRAAVVVIQNGQHVLREDMLWGFPKYAGTFGTTFRTIKNPRWKPWLSRKHRCVVPATAFVEVGKNIPKGDMMWRWHKRTDGLPFCFAGIWRPWTGNRGTKKAPNIGNHSVFSILTNEPHDVVQPVVEQVMPVILMTAEQVEAWLMGSSVECALAMQRLAPDDVLAIGPPVKPARLAT